MTYVSIAGIIILVTSIKLISFGIWQMGQKNIVGGISVFALAILQGVLILQKFFE